MNNYAERIRELAQLVRYHADLYFNKNAPELTDGEFDSLVAELRGLVEECRAQGIEEDAVAEGEMALGEVGSVPSYGKKVTHSSVMGSLDKAHSVSEATEWHSKYGFLLGIRDGNKVAETPKMDGCAVRLNYDKGFLVEAATRGDGAIGQDVTDNVREIADIPKAISYKGLVEVRGEVYMKKSVFKKLNELLRARGEKPFANPRNAAGGSLMAKDPKVTGERSLSFGAYDVKSDVVFQTEAEKHGWMVTNLNGADVVPMKIISIAEFESESLTWEVNRPTLDYDIDGLVLALNSIEAQNEAGWNGNNPRGKVAFKFKPEQKVALVRKIDRQVGRTGRLTPMCRIEPTLVAGSTITNITLHNEDIMNELGVCEGDEVLIEKAGDIIPQVVRVVKKGSGVPSTPTSCPSCGGMLERPLVTVRNEKKELVQVPAPNYWCNNLECPAQLERRVLHFVKTLDMLGIGEGIVSSLCREGFVKDVPDLYFLTMAQLQSVTGGERAAEKAMKAILGKNSIPLPVFLDSLGIDGLGTTTSKDVAAKFKTLAAVRGASEDQLDEVAGIASLTAGKITSGMRTLSNMIDRLVGVIEVQEVKDSSGPLKGMSFCLTGAMSKGRKEIESAIEAAGGICKGSVGKGLTYLVQADASSTSGKTEKAKACGTKILAEADLWKMMQ